MRSLPVMRRLTIAAFSAVVVTMLAGVTAAAPTRSAIVRLYFVSSSGRTLVPVVRLTPRANARAVVTAVVGGPNQAERARGATAVIPQGSHLLSVRSARGRASVAFRSSSLIKLSMIPRLRVIASLTYTLTGLTGIHSVRFTVNGRSWGVYNMQGHVIRDYSRRSLRPGMNACAPGDGCFSP